MGTETLKHKYAKNALAKFLEAEVINANAKIIQEWPITLDEKGAMHGLKFGDHNSLIYENLINAKLLPIIIFDIAIMRDDILHRAWEVTYTSSINSKKIQYASRVAKELHDMGSSTFELVEFDADSVLQRAPFNSHNPCCKNGWRWENGILVASSKMTILEQVKND